MVALTELTRADAFIYGILSPDTALLAALGAAGGNIPIYNGVAPQGVTGKYLVFKNQTEGTDVLGVNAARIYTDVLYLVRVINKTTDYGTIEAAAQRLDQILHRSSGANVSACWRIRGFHQEETTDAGVEYRHLGGFYRLYVQ